MSTPLSRDEDANRLLRAVDPYRNGLDQELTSAVAAALARDEAEASLEPGGRYLDPADILAAQVSNLITLDLWRVAWEITRKNPAAATRLFRQLILWSNERCQKFPTLHTTLDSTTQCGSPSLPNPKTPNQEP